MVGWALVVGWALGPLAEGGMTFGGHLYHPLIK